MKFRLIALAALLTATLSAQADTLVFADNFDTNTLALNAVPTGWTIANNGTVDIIGDPSFYDFIPGSGRYIDLDGSTGQAGLLSKSVMLTAGTTYTASFDLAGNHLNDAVESVAVNFGAANGTYSLPQTAGWTNYSLVFTATSTASHTLSFLNNGNDNMGMLLDNVSITAVPEPQTWALMVGGLLAVGSLARRRAAR